MYANSRLLEMQGVSEAEYIGSANTEKFYVNPDQQKEFLELSKKQGFLRDEEAQMKRQDGSEFWVLVSVMPFEYEMGEALIVFQDGNRHMASKTAFNHFLCPGMGYLLEVRTHRLSLFI